MLRAACTSLAALATGALCLIAVPGPASAATAPAWHALEVRQQPGAFGGASLYARFETISCTAVGWCVAGGVDNDLRAVLATETAGRWSAASRLPMPPGSQGSEVTGVSCTRKTACTAVGTLGNGSDALATTEQSGTWSSPIRIARPARTGGGRPGDSLTSVSCTSPGNCVAVGAYVTGSAELPMRVTEVAGKWQPAVAVQLPAAAGHVARQAAFLTSVSCHSAGSCVAVGGYLSKTGAHEVMAVSQVRGRWAMALALRLPANAFSSAHEPQAAGTSSVSCAARMCMAVGSYTDRKGVPHGMMIIGRNGRWARAAEVASATIGRARFAPLFQAVSCTRSRCTAAAFSSGFAYGALTLGYSLGHWSRASRVGNPGNGRTHSGFLAELSCLNSGACAGAGDYVARSGAVELMAASRN